MVFVVKREIFTLIRIIASCLSAALILFFISSLSGEDLMKINSDIDRSRDLIALIDAELSSGIDRRISQLGEVPAQNPFRKFYCIELAKEIHELSKLTEKQRMMFDVYNVRSFESQLRRMMGYTENGDVNSLMDELDVVKRELKNSANLVEKMRDKLIRQRTAYIVLFMAFWIVLYLYFSRGIVFKKSNSA